MVAVVVLQQRRYIIRPGSPKNLHIRHFSTLGSTCPDNLRNTRFSAEIYSEFRVPYKHQINGSRTRGHSFCSLGNINYVLKRILFAIYCKDNGTILHMSVVFILSGRNLFNNIGLSNESKVILLRV